MKSDTLPGYTLVICEKSDVARKVATSLGSESVKTLNVGGVEVFECNNGDERYVVCSAAGHLYSISDSFKRREVYPVFDLEWFPICLIDKNSRRLDSKIRAIERLAKGASRFINACDYDVEGETIGHNILRYACGERENDAFRAKFSTLTQEELISSIREARPGLATGLAKAGRTRHMLDFIWGINLSRALSTSLARTYSGYRTISMGRVQGPTLAFVVERETEVGCFVPTPYWVVRGIFDKDGTRFEAPHATSKIPRRSTAETIKKACEGKTATISEVGRSVFKEPPPPPFNIGDLQKEAYRVFRFTPTRTLQIAERLYLNALISYPRTGSQKLPTTIRYTEILSRLAGIGEYNNLVKELMEGKLTPREGDKMDLAHPAIYPTGERPKRLLDAQEMRIFDLVVRRFLACFAENAIRERASAKVVVGEEEFRLVGRRTLKSGWINYYSKYTGIEDRWIPSLREGDVLAIVKIENDEKLEQRPPRYNQSSLLEKMEKEGIGTKATRAEIISTLINRGYVSKDSLAATDLGLSLIETMQEYSPQVISTALTRETEKALEEIEIGASDGSELIERVIDILSKQIELVKANELEIGMEMGRSAIETTLLETIIGNCPVCKQGKLRIIRSLKTRKRFVGCTNYSTGCRASAPLPQRGTVKTTGKQCGYCGWPVVYVRSGRYPWRLCVNVNCETKVRKSEMQTLQKKSHA